jgi:hypothetical protein
VSRSPGRYVGTIDDPSTVTRRTKNSRIRVTARRYPRHMTILQFGTAFASLSARKRKATL